jgi:hypothetical protein
MSLIFKRAAIVVAVTLAVFIVTAGDYELQVQAAQQATTAGCEKTVHVKGYKRKDGTYVAPYDRRPPGCGMSTTATPPSVSETKPPASAQPGGQSAAAPGVGATSVEAPMTDASTVFLITDGDGATALYHRAGCPWLKLGGGVKPMKLSEARKRFFQPHCLCITGREGAPPCQ